jgi:hypothetical protein
VCLERNVTEIVVATYVGCYSISEDGKKIVDFDTRHVTSLVPEKDGCLLALVDGWEIWRRSASREWSLLIKTDEPLSLISYIDGRIFVSFADARLAIIDEGGKLERLTGFDTVDGRREWFDQGPPLHIRAMTVTADGAAILAAVHVGGIPRSVDGGKSWAPTVPVDFDVHEVRAHSALPNIVAAAAAIGFCVSHDGGLKWDVIAEGPEDPHALAVAALDREIIFSVQDGPFADRSQLWRWNIGETGIEQVRDGLPEWFSGKVDTAHIAAGNGRAALVDGGGNLWLSSQGASGWRQVGVGVPFVFGMVVV